MDIPTGVTHYQHLPKYPSVTFINEFSEQMGLQDPLEGIDILTQSDGMWQRIP